MFNTIIIENFFDNFEYLKNHFKKIPLLKYNNYPQNHKATKTERINLMKKKSLPFTD